MCLIQVTRACDTRNLSVSMMFAVIAKLDEACQAVILFPEVVGSMVDGPAGNFELFVGNACILVSFSCYIMIDDSCCMIVDARSSKPPYWSVAFRVSNNIIYISTQL